MLCEGHSVHGGRELPAPRRFVGKMLQASCLCIKIAAMREGCYIRSVSASDCLPPVPSSPVPRFFPGEVRGLGHLPGLAGPRALGAMHAAPFLPVGAARMRNAPASA